MGVIDQDQDLITISNFISKLKEFIITMQIESGDNNPDLDYIFVKGRNK